MNSEEDSSISALESCRAAEARIQEAQRLLMSAGRQSLEVCLRGLDEAASLLEAVASAGPYSAGRGDAKGAALSAAVHRIQRSAQVLRLQIEFASNFWRGWLQRRAGKGYTHQGLPVFVDHGSRSFEG